jgi:hypothetical protein
MATKLTAEALEGFNKVDVRYLATSAAWYGYHLGVYLYVTGRPAPHDVRMGRGAIVHCGDTSYRHIGTCDGRQQFERIK